MTEQFLNREIHAKDLLAAIQHYAQTQQIWEMLFKEWK